jgi:hypothetical protein
MLILPFVIRSSAGSTARTSSAANPNQSAVDSSATSAASPGAGAQFATMTLHAMSF